MTYWHLQMYKNLSEKGELEKELFNEHSIILFGESHIGKEQINQFKKEMSIGDIVLIKKGATPIALVEVLGDCEKVKDGDIDSSKFYSYNYKRKIKVLDYANKNMKKFPQPQRNLQKSSNKNTPTYQYINNWYTQTLQKDYNKDELIEKTYKIKELYIKDNHKIFQDFKIDFTSDGKNPLPIIVIAGKNGTGKTTLLEYLANFEIKDSDYIEIFKVREPVGLEDDFDANDLIIDSFKIFEKMGGGVQQKRHTEYKKHIEYLPVYSNKITDVKDFILKKHRKRSRELDSIKKATQEIGDFIENTFADMNLSFKLIDVDDTERDNEKIIFKNKNSKEFDINNLSTGEKTLLSKVLYLYFKGVKNQIILIDEPELSLHPRWQNQVLKLYENFAKENNCQIIIATHSPHIIGSAKNEWIRILTEDEVINDVLAYGRDIEWVLEEVMGASYTRESTIAKKIEECQELLNDEKYDEAEECINSLEATIGKNDTEIMDLRNALFFERD